MTSNESKKPPGPLANIVKKFKEPEFSHKETLRITGLTADTLLTWHKRGFVPTALGGRGRGHRRKYSVLDLAYLMVVSELSAAGTSLAEAVAYATGSLSMILMHFVSLKDPVTTLLVAYKMNNSDSWYRFDLLTSEDLAAAGGVEAWMRKRGLIWVKMLDYYTLTVRLFARIHETKQARRGAAPQSNTEQ